MTEIRMGNHPENINRLERFSELTGLEIEDPRKRVSTISGIDPDKFLDILAIVNGLLRDEDKFIRWDDTPLNVQVSSLALGVDIDPPDNSKEIFKQFFDIFQSELDPSKEGLEKAAIEMYFAIIGSHMFEDGNGRTARAAYQLIRYGELPDKQSIIIDRQDKTVEAAWRVNIETIIQLFDAEGYVKGKDYEHFDDLVADEYTDSDDDYFKDGGLTQQLKYIAARRVLEQAGVWEEKGSQMLGLKDWPIKYLEEYRKEYAQVRADWLVAYIEIASKFHRSLAKLIET